MKEQKKRVGIYTFLILIILTMTGCGNKTKNEEEILADIMLENEVFQTYQDLNVVEFVINDRMTDKNNKTDRVYFLLKVENEDISYELSGHLYYYLYDQGWKLESSAQERECILPLKSDITQEMADTVAEAIASNYSSWEVTFTNRETILDYYEDHFFYKIIDNSAPYWTEEHILNITYRFDETEGWAYDSYDISEARGYWNEEALCGTWRTDKVGLSGYFEITIYDVLENDECISAYYECDFNSVGLTKPLQKIVYGGMDFSNDWSYCVHQGMLQSFYIELDRYHGVIFGGYYCDKTRIMNTLRTPNLLAPVNELEDRTENAYGELLKRIISDQTEETLHSIVYAEEFDMMCTEYLNTISEDCIIYKDESEYVILHHIIVPENDEVKPYYDYMFLCFNEDTGKGVLFGKCSCSLLEEPIFYYVKGMWGASYIESGTTDELVYGYYPMAVNYQYVAFPNGWTSIVEGDTVRGIWNSNVNYNSESDDGSYLKHEMTFCLGYYIDALEGGVCLNYTRYDAETGQIFSMSEQNKSAHQENAFGILGYGSVYY